MAEITPRERFLAAFEHRETDRVPVYDAPNNPLLFKHFLGKENYYSEGVPIVQLSKKMGMDAALVAERGYSGLISPYWRWEDETHFIDELGIPFSVNESSWPLGIPHGETITGRADWEKITLPEVREDWRTAEICKAVCEAHQGRGDDIAVIAGMRSAFAVMYISMGLESLSLNLYDDPDLIEEMSATLCDFWTQSSIKAVELGADVIFIANDMGFNTGTIIDPDRLRSFFLPHLQKQIEEIHRAGGWVILHSCGNIRAILDDLVAMGADCYNNVQVAAGMDIREIKQRYGEELTLMGNVDCTNIMPRATPAQIEEAVKETIRVASPGGGHILATDHSFHKGVPIENVKAFLEAGKKWGRYPITI